jgi:hypothetical protein
MVERGGLILSHKPLIALGHLGSKLQPVRALLGSGGRPGIALSFLGDSIRGMLSNNITVYGCIGLARISVDKPSSTISPEYIIAILLQRWGAKAISWVTTIMETL